MARLCDFFYNFGDCLNSLAIFFGKRPRFWAILKYGFNKRFFALNYLVTLGQWNSVVTLEFSFGLSGLSSLHKCQFIFYTNSVARFKFISLNYFFLNGPFPASFSLFSSFQYTVDRKQMFNINKF